MNEDGPNGSLYETLMKHDQSETKCDRGSAVDNFAVELLRQLGYVKRNRVAHTQKDILYYICGEWRHAKPDICLLNCLQDHDILLLIQEDIPFLPEDLLCGDPQAQLIANAIAAFGENNRNILETTTIESRACGSSYFSDVLHSLTMKIMPGIMLKGTMPIFYKIPVTLNLIYNIWSGTHPSEPTIVSAHVPNLPSPHCRYNKGMKPLDNRQAVLCSYEAFKHIIGI
jgi:hypothetical protein